MTLLSITLIVCKITLGLAMLAGLYRLIKGPTIFDRILAFDLIAICSIGLMTLLSIEWHTAIFLELILIFSLLGFTGTVALTFFLGGKKTEGSP